MPKVKLTLYAVLIFIVVLACARISEAKADPYIGLGKSVVNTSVTTGVAGYVFDEKWDVQVQVFGEGITDKGEQSHVESASFSRIIVPNWNIGHCGYFMRIGVAYVHDSPLVGRGNYRLGLGCRYGPLALEYGHVSSAGINERNTGLDFITFTLYL